MLDVALDLKIGGGAAATIARQAESLLEILIRLFAEKLLAEARRGLPRAYFQHEDNLPALRGRLNVVRQFTAHAVRPDRLACRFDVLSSDIPLLQIMKACVLVLRRLARAADTVRALDELRFVLADIADVSAAALPWQAVRIDRTNRRWEALFGLARLFLKRDWQATHYDPFGHQGITLLFPMNDLFEAYIAAVMRRSLRPAGLSVETQAGRLYCLVEEGDQRQKRFQTRPDIIVRDCQSRRLVAIIDTKWKRLSPAIEDAKHGVSQPDIYQIITYSQLYACSEVFLLYPHHLALESRPFAADYLIHGSTDRLYLRSIDISQEEAQIDADIAAMFKRLQTEPPPACA
jgi:5-methylcytosine-specific restriction enzyme subunit McrC